MVVDGLVLLAGAHICSDRTEEACNTQLGGRLDIHMEDVPAEEVEGDSSQEQEDSCQVVGNLQDSRWLVDNLDILLVPVDSSCTELVDPHEVLEEEELVDHREVQEEEDHEAQVLGVVSVRAGCEERERQLA